jgi:hypothetical protein
MTKFFRDCFTGPNGTTWQWLRVGIGIGTVMMALGMGVMCLVAGRSIILGTPLDYVAFATGMAAMATGFSAVLMAGGGALWASKDTEPQVVTATQTTPTGTTSQTVEAGAAKTEGT